MVPTSLVNAHLFTLNRLPEPPFTNAKHLHINLRCINSHFSYNLITQIKLSTTGAAQCTYMNFNIQNFTHVGLFTSPGNLVKIAIKKGNHTKPRKDPLYFGPDPMGRTVGLPWCEYAFRLPTRRQHQCIPLSHRAFPATLAPPPGPQPPLPVPPAAQDPVQPARPVQAVRAGDVGQPLHPHRGMFRRAPRLAELPLRGHLHAAALAIALAVLHAVALAQVHHHAAAAGQESLQSPGHFHLQEAVVRWRQGGGFGVGLRRGRLETLLDYRITIWTPPTPPRPCSLLSEFA